MNTRKQHRQLSLLLVLPLLLTTATGVAYRLGHSWFGLSKDFAKIILKVHTAAFLGEKGELIYVVVVGLGVIFLAFSGLTLIQRKILMRPQRVKRFDHRMVHHLLSGVILIPLAVTAATGVLFHIGYYYLGLPEEVADILMMLHQGGFLGRALRPVYVLLLGIGVGLLSWTGVNMLFKGRRKRVSAVDSVDLM
ncbi:MAG: PepSY domain-containing protein [Thermosynechococcus sp.]|uniref:PepSY domain-containing protein n=1 Tax=Thermosynechococcus sp. TaxID=2814275 RepID=UPI00391A7ED9